jgi:hypothetical protein
MILAFALWEFGTILSHVLPYQEQGGRTVTWRSRVQFQIKWLNLFSLHNPYSRNVVLGWTRSSREMSVENFPGNKLPKVLIAHKLTPISQPIVYKIWHPQCLTTLSGATTCHNDGLSFSILYLYYFPEKLVLRLSFCWDIVTLCPRRSFLQQCDIVV